MILIWKFLPLFWKESGDLYVIWIQHEKKKPVGKEKLVMQNSSVFFFICFAEMTQPINSKTQTQVPNQEKEMQSENSYWNVCPNYRE